MTTPDFVYLALIAILLLLDYFVLWPAFLRRSQADPGRARLWLWSGWMVMLWTLVVAGAALWLFEGRAWSALRLVVPRGWRLWGTVALGLALAISYARIVARIARSKSQRIKLGNPHAEKLTPHTQSELRWWVAVSLSAGVGEEFVFRGYLIWAFQPMLGLAGASLFSLLIFATAHAYQGAKGILATGIAGGLLTLVVLVSGSLLPAMVLHTLVDIGSGLVAWSAFRRSSAQLIVGAAGLLTLGPGSPCVQAQIHESYQACVTRYGQPIEKPDGASLMPQKLDRLVHFERGAYTVTIGFIADRAVSVVFAHTDGSPLSPLAVIDLLKENSEGAGFMARRGPPVAGKNFIRSDHKVAALWARIEGKLLIWDTAY